MSEVITVQDLEILKKHEIFEAEVITGKAGGVAGGAEIDYATNGTTLQTQKTLPKTLEDVEAQFAGMGYTRVGTFATGGTLTSPRQTLLWETSAGGDGQEYGWTGAFPKTVPPGSTPLTTGGIATGVWVSRFDPTLRGQTLEALRRSYAEGGYILVGGSFELGGTVTVVNEVLLYEGDGRAYVWGGALPKTVPANSTPTSAGGIGAGAWSVAARIGSYKSIPLALASPLTVGDYIDVDHYVFGDGAKHVRRISAADDGSGVQLNSGLWANIVPVKGCVDASWFNVETAGSGPKMTKCFTYCNSTGVVLTAGYLKLSGVLPVCNMHISHLDDVNMQLTHSAMTGNLEITLDKYTYAQYNLPRCAISYPVGSEKNVTIRIGKAIGAPVTTAAGVTGMSVCFKVDNTNELIFTVDEFSYCERFLTALDNVKTAKIEVGRGYNFLTGIYIYADHLTITRGSARCTPEFRALVLANGIALNGRDLVLGGGLVSSTIKNLDSNDCMERGFYLQFDGTDNQISNILEDRELKTIGKNAGTKTANISVSDFKVEHRLTGTWPITAYDAGTVTYTNGSVLAPILSAPMQFKNIDFLSFIDCNIDIRATTMFAAASAGTPAIGQVSISKGSNIQVARLIDFSNGFNVEATIIEESTIRTSNGANFGLFDFNIAGQGASLTVNNSDIVCGAMLKLAGNGVTSAFSNSTIMASDIDVNFTASSVNTTGFSFYNTVLYARKLYGSAASFEGTFKTAVNNASQRPLDYWFTDLKLCPATATINVSLRNYECEAFAPAGHCKFKVVGGVRTDIIGVPSGIVNPNTASEYLGVPPGVLVIVHSLS